MPESSRTLHCSTTGSQETQSEEEQLTALATSCSQSYLYIYKLLDISLSFAIMDISI